MTPTGDIRASLLAWYDEHHRDLPWRREPTPWRVWVSEVMLQQTRVESVVGYFERFVARFPDPSTLARAPLDDVLTLWAGLGYYARARHLHRAAQQVVERHDGEVPADPDAFGALRGVGPYTRGAVQSIAFGHREPVLDGNVERVLCRLDRIQDDPRGSAPRRALWARAAELVPEVRAGDFNQALMELGAVVCTPRAPDCDDCPVALHCRARRSGDAAQLPRKPRRNQRRAVDVVSGLAHSEEGAVWLVRRPEDGLLGGLWELPSVEGSSAPGDLAQLGLFAHGEATVVRHVFTHLEWTLHTYAAHGTPRTDATLRAVDEDALGDIALTGPALKALRASGVRAPRRRGAGSGPTRARTSRP